MKSPSRQIDGVGLSSVNDLSNKYFFFQFPIKYPKLN